MHTDKRRRIARLEQVEARKPPAGASAYVRRVWGLTNGPHYLDALATFGREGEGR